MQVKISSENLIDSIENLQPFFFIIHLKMSIFKIKKKKKKRI